MTTAAPAAASCGTATPGWLNGVHPTLAEGVAEKEVCFAAPGDAPGSCNQRVSAQVKMCPGGFYVYSLPGPDSVAPCRRYCGDVAPVSTVKPPTTPTPVYNAQCQRAYATLSSTSRSQAFNDGDDLVEVCDTPTLAGQVNSGPASNNDWVGPGWCVFQVVFFVIFIYYCC
jgi:hypothetical protein